MEPGGVVIELDPYQFNYPLYTRIVPQYGHFYICYEAPLKDTKIQGFNLLRHFKPILLLANVPRKDAMVASQTIGVLILSWIFLLLLTFFVRR